MIAISLQHQILSILIMRCTNYYCTKDLSIWIQRCFDFRHILYRFKFTQPLKITLAPLEEQLKTCAIDKEQ